jgi:hypothetical protein
MGDTREEATSKYTPDLQTRPEENSAGAVEAEGRGHHFFAGTRVKRWLFRTTCGIVRV